MRINNIGIFLAAIYLAGLVACVIWAQFISDPKGQYVILQLPVVLQHGVLLFADATHLLNGMSWPTIYMVLGLPMIIALIFVGKIIEIIISKMRFNRKPLTNRACE